MQLIQGAQLLPFPSAELVGERPRNAAIAHMGGRLFMVYRNGPLGSTKELRLCELDQQYHPITDRILLNGAVPCEDPRLSLFDNRLWVSYHMATKAKRSIGIAEVLPDSDVPIGQSWEFPKFQAVEKNWVPLAHDQGGSFLWSYDLNLEHRTKMINGETGEVRAHMGAAGAVPRYGPVRGGTNFYPWQHRGLFAIAHSSVAYGHGTRKYRRHYVAFPVLIDNKPPYTVFQTGALIMAGGEYGGGYRNGTRKSVVFPCGLTKHPDGFLVSLGHNDREVKLVVFPPDVIEQAFNRGPQKEPLKEFYRRVQNGK